MECKICEKEVEDVQDVKFQLVDKSGKTIGVVHEHCLTMAQEAAREFPTPGKQPIG